MVDQSTWCISILSIIVFVYSNDANMINPYGVNVCSSQISYSQIYQESYQYSRKVSYTTKCGFWNFKRCTRYRTVYGTRYRAATRQVYRLQYHCCKGWKQVRDQCSQAICQQPCVKGTCTQPDHCSCTSGYHGIQCDKDCPSHKWGPHCSHDCLCQNNSTCSPYVGNCTCAPGWHGQYCNQSCDHGYYGNNCQNKCQCQNGSQCDVIMGTCTCAVGFIGIRCDKQCPQGFYGQNCTLKCACASGLCDHVNGSCECIAYSPDDNCSPISGCGTCLHGGECDAKTGSCNCTEGWTGEKCEQKCPRGRYGYSCAQKCSNHCRDDSDCDHVTGKCDCRPGYSGERCKTRCKEGTFGLHCSNICACKNNSTCAPFNGSCDCAPGFTGVHCDICSDGRDCRNRETHSDVTSDVNNENVTVPIILSVIPLVILIFIAIGCFMRYKRSKRMRETNETSDSYTEVTETTTTSPTRTAMSNLNEERIYQTPSSHQSTVANDRNSNSESRHYDEPVAHPGHPAVTSPQNHIYATPSIKYQSAAAHNGDDASVVMATRNYMELQKPSSLNIYEPMSPATRNGTGVTVLSSEYDIPNIRNTNGNDDGESPDNDYQQLQHQDDNDYEHLNNSTRNSTNNTSLECVSNQDDLV